MLLGFFLFLAYPFHGKFNIISRIQIMNSGFFYAVLDGDTKDIQQKSNAKEGAVVRNGKAFDG